MNNQRAAILHWKTSCLILFKPKSNSRCPKLPKTKNLCLIHAATAFSEELLMIVSSQVYTLRPLASW